MKAIILAAGYATRLYPLTKDAAAFFFKVYNHPYVKAVLYGLRPVITGIILYADPCETKWK